jgi:hypothetical protein
MRVWPKELLIDITQELIDADEQDGVPTHRTRSCNCPIARAMNKALELDGTDYYSMVGGRARVISNQTLTEAVYYHLPPAAIKFINIADQRMRTTWSPKPEPTKLLLSRM